MSEPIAVLRAALEGRYEIERELGRGAFATVYLAHDLRHDRRVALKVLDADPDSELGELRFVREIRLLARLQHPNILPLHDSGHVENVLYYVMPFVSGETLRDRIGRVRQLLVDDAVAIARELADALAYAHGCGVIHRDIKPENVLLSAGRPIIADFGVARALDASGFRQLTRPGSASPGTPAYMSPEQLLGERDVDARSDIYSLGCVLYEMLTGKPPFPGKDGFVRRFTEPPPRVSATRDVPPWLDGVITRALGRTPGERYGTAGEMGDALAAGQSDAGSAPVADPGAAAPAQVGVGEKVLPPSPARPEEETSSPPPITPLPPAPAEPPEAAAPRRSWRTWRWPIAAVVVLAAMPGWWAWSRTRTVSASDLDANLVAVAPFYVASSDAELQRWRRDLALLVQQHLDGAGPIRALTPSVSMREWPAVADRAAAAELGRRLGAGLVVFGTVSATGPSNVQVSAKVLDVARDVIVDEVPATDSGAPPDQLLARVSDVLTRKLFTSLGSIRPLAAVRRAPFGCASSSWQAVRAYLRGEQFYRATAWDSATAAYRDAISFDSTCALAYRRLATAQGWEAAVDDSLSLVYELHAGANNHRLAPRDSLLVTADSLEAALSITWGRPIPSPTFWGWARRLFTLLAEAGRRYPGDAEVWNALGDAQYHHGWGPASESPAAILASFDHAIALDSGFAMSYLHPIELAFGMGGYARARPYLEGYLATRPTSALADGVRLAATIAAPHAEPGASERAIAAASTPALTSARERLERWPDSAETALHLSRVILSRTGHDSATGPGSCRESRKGFARRLAYRGHLHAARCALDDDLRGYQYMELALLGAVPADSVERVFDGWLRDSTSLLTFALPWLLERGDTARISAFQRRAEAILRGSRTAVVRQRAQYDSAAALAYLALARRDPSALARFMALPDTLCQGCFDLDRLVTTRLLASAGRTREALRVASEWRGDLVSAYEVLFALERARIAERLGERGQARAAYELVAAVWANGDREVQGMVTEARDALHRLGR
jgi:tRNA A-37 threonylcarbamoyl transferase component Bud32